MLAVVLVVWELAKLAVTEAKVRLLGVPRGVGVEKKCPIEDVNFTLTQERLKEVHTVVMDRMPDSGIYRVWSGAAVERALTDALGALAVNIKATNDLVRKLDEYITEERQHAQR